MQIQLGSRKGTIFVTVVMILSILLILLGLLLTIASTDVRASRSYSDGVRTYYLAQSGVETAIANIMVNRRSNSVDTEMDKITGTPEYSDGTGRLYSVNWNVVYNGIDSTDNNMEKYTISSLAIYKTKYKRTLEVVISVDNAGKVVVKKWQQK